MYQNQTKVNTMLAKRENYLVKYSPGNLKSFGKIDSIKKEKQTEQK